MTALNRELFECIHRVFSCELVKLVITHGQVDYSRDRKDLESLAKIVSLHVHAIDSGHVDLFLVLLVIGIPGWVEVDAVRTLW